MARLVGEVKSQLDVSKTQEFGESAADRYSRRTANATFALAVIAVITLAAAVLSAAFVYDQFKEMSVQTGLMNVAAKQARRDSDASSVATAKQLGVLQRQIDAAQKGSKALQDQLIQSGHAFNLATRQFETSQRAWIGITNESITFLKFPLDGGLSINTQLTYTNAGNLPATNVHVFPEVFLPDQTLDILDQAKSEQRKVCEKGRTDPQMTRFAIAQTVYPGKRKDFWWSTGMRIDKSGMIRKDGGLSPLIVGCVYYRFNSSPGIHETPFIFDVHHKSADGQIDDLRFGEEFPVGDVYVSDFWSGEAETEYP